MGNLATPKSVQKLQTALHAKAKAEAGYRFYALYDKIYRDDILTHAYAQCRSNQGAPGVDAQDFAQVEAYGLERWLGELALALRNEDYRPDPIRRVFIPKANSTAKSPKLRPLGISTLRDRVCMTAAMLVLEPIFEADLPPEQYAYRPGRNAQQAVIEVEETLFRGHPEVVDADLADYFGSIPHAELMLSLARRIVDRRVLHLIKMWLECAVEETDKRGRKTRTTQAKDQRRGIPQGSPISPILSNTFLHYAFDLWMARTHPDLLWCRYADDGLVHCRSEQEAQALKGELHARLEACGLELHPTKTKIVYCKDGKRRGTYPNVQFDFLGYCFRPRLVRRRRDNTLFCGFNPAVSVSALKAMRLMIRDLNLRRQTQLALHDIAQQINPLLRGWLEYYGRYAPSALYPLLRYVNQTLLAWAMRKFKRFKAHKIRASGFLQRLAADRSDLFAHWQLGMVGTFA